MAAVVAVAGTARGSPLPAVVRALAGAGEPAGVAPETRERGERLAPRAERRLVRDAQNGSRAAIEELFRIHWPRAHRAAYLIVHDGPAAEDVAQEAFLSALRALDRFDRRRPFGPWLYRIVANRAIDHARARRLRREVDAEGADPPATLDPPTRPYSDEVVAALAALAPDRRAVVVLRHVLELTPGEIAAALDLPRGTVNSRLRRGLDELRSHLEDGER